jgi:hypothetical protein
MAKLDYSKVPRKQLGPVIDYFESNKMAEHLRGPARIAASNRMTDWYHKVGHRTMSKEKFARWLESKLEQYK